jgi:hypothetical protein
MSDGSRQAIEVITADVIPIKVKAVAVTVPAAAFS